MRVCVCVSVREKERDRTIKRERERERVGVETERARGRESVFGCVRVCVERERERVCVLRCEPRSYSRDSQDSLTRGSSKTWNACVYVCVREKGAAGVSVGVCV